MVNTDLWSKHFKLSELQTSQLSSLPNLYKTWNAQINVVSRKDIDALPLHHILHSLAISKFIEFKKDTKILDLGTGGGFPGVPLAIMNPETQFTLLDARAKKLKVVDDIAEQLKLKNIKSKHARVEDITEKFDFITTRAVASFEKLIPWTKKLISSKEKSSIPNGLIALKGGDLTDELKILKKHAYYEVYPINDYFEDPYFKEKYLIYAQF